MRMGIESYWVINKCLFNDQPCNTTDNRVTYDVELSNLEYPSMSIAVLVLEQIKTSKT